MNRAHLHTRTVAFVLVIAVFAAAYLMFAPGAHTPRIGDASASASAGSPGTTFSVLSRPATSKDDVSAWKAAALGAQKRTGVNPTLDFSNARLLYQDAGRAVAAVPTSSGACIATQSVDGSGALTCSPAINYGNSVGLVPDAVKSVTFTLADGTQVDQNITENYWRAPAEAAKVSYVVDGQPQGVALMPLSSLPKGAQISPSGVVSAGDTSAG